MVTAHRLIVAINERCISNSNHILFIKMTVIMITLITVVIIIHFNIQSDIGLPQNDYKYSMNRSSITSFV